MKQEVRTANAPAAIGPYSQAIRLVPAGLVYTAGQLGIDPRSGALVPGGIEAECRQALENLRAVLEAAGADLGRVVKTTVFLREMSDFARMNTIYAEFFPPPCPARSAFAVAALPKDAHFEIEAVAEAD